MVTFDTMPASFRPRLERARDLAVAALLRERGPEGHWVGELSSSALSTATAVTALTLVARGESDPAVAGRLGELVARGYGWLSAHQNPDGGWGDTVRSRSNISTTTLVWAALGLAPAGFPGLAAAIARVERWLSASVGSLEPDVLVGAIERRYGRDRTFSIPILTMCALCGRLGPEQDGWRRVRQLPFELAALPQTWFGAMQLPVVSYALPALIAIGQVRHGRRPTGNPVLRGLRNRCAARTLKKLGQLQPANGGFLEATPLTSFVTMSLAAIGLSGHQVVRRGVAFIEASLRVDGSWPIDTNLATWVTTLSIQALGTLPDAGRGAIRDWLLQQQYRAVHSYTLAAPGGWAWTDLPGGVPDADDTPGALLALQALAGGDREVLAAAEAGVGWLLDLQNRDGGMPTFCRGWGKLPFDRSSPDLTAHAIRAWLAWVEALSGTLRERVGSGLDRAADFLVRTQRLDGAWIPLWFGHEEDPADENPLYGTARVIPALCELERKGQVNNRGQVKNGGQADFKGQANISGEEFKGQVDITGALGWAFKGQVNFTEALERAIAWLRTRQNPDGGWSGAIGAASSVEETGIALEALAVAWEREGGDSGARAALRAAIERGAGWLVTAVETDRWREPAAIGFYFAKLWYCERLYPLIFATGALVRVARLRL